MTAWLDDPIQAVDARPVSGTNIAASSPLISSTLGFVSPMGIQEEDSFYPFNLTNTAGNLDLTGYTNVGNAVAWDPSAPNSVRLAQANDTVIGALMSYENRSQQGLLVCTVALRGCFPFPIDTTVGATPPVLGGSIKGGTIPGTVVAAAMPAGSRNTVLFVDPNGTYVSFIF